MSLIHALRRIFGRSHLDLAKGRLMIENGDLGVEIPLVAFFDFDPPQKKNVNIIFSILWGGFQLFTMLTKTVDQGAVKHCHGTLRHPN